jgi:hypothetical protein
VRRINSCPSTVGFLYGVSPAAYIQNVHYVTRHVLIRAEDGDRLVAESTLPAEANLHDALALNPQLIPTTDLGLGRVVVVGLESSLASGYADLILADDMGQVCLVEVKKEGNPDTRHVVAQLFDYAASLWGQTIDEFTETVLRPYLRKSGNNDAMTVSDFIGASFTNEGDTNVGEMADIALITRNLAATLERGTFVLVVVAPEIPPGVERALQYLNAQGLRLFALEVGYFRGQVECFVPRLAVVPPPAPSSRSASSAPVEREEFLESLDELVSPVVALALDACVEAGARLEWNSYGASIKVALERMRQIGFFERRRMGVTLQAPSGFPRDPFLRAKASLDEIGVGEPLEDGWYHRVGYSEASPDELQQVADVLVELCRELTDRIEWEELSPPHEETFARNDYNVWLRRAPGLAQFRSKYVRGRILRLPDGDDTAVQFAPLSGEAPGWKPQFADIGVRDKVWPPRDHTGDYRLIVTAVGRPR